MVSQRTLVTFGLLIGMSIGMLYSAYQSVTGATNPYSRSIWSSSVAPVVPTETSQLIAAGILDDASGPDLAADVIHEGLSPVFVAKPLPRVCGSPAIDGYAHVDLACLLKSPTAAAWFALHPRGGKSGENLKCNKEYAVNIDGLAVSWGGTNKKASPEECCKSCRNHEPGPHVRGPYQKLPCNAWVFCPQQECFEADGHKHTKGDCWLKFTEAPQDPEINARGDFSGKFRERHRTAPKRTPWISGVLLPPGQSLTNGTWGPRASW